MNLNGVEYYYVRNGQGDIIALIDSNGNEVVTYTYDSWGKIISIDGSLKDTVGVKNPYRYRGYRYDKETKLYYLQSRYYNPEWGRFVNLDGTFGEFSTLLDHNLFLYCRNNVVNLYDPAGFGGQIIDLGGGWKARIDPPNPNMNLKRHVHVYKGGNEWAQNDDGSPHDKGTTNSGEPNESVKKRLKDKTGWDWDKKSKEYKEKKKQDKNANNKNNIITEGITKGLVIGVSGYMIYRGIRMLPSLLPPLWWTLPANAVCP